MKYTLTKKEQKILKKIKQKYEKMYLEETSKFFTKIIVKRKLL